MSDHHLNESIFKQIVETNWSAITYADLNGVLTYVNDAANLLYGYNKGELIGKSVDIFNADDELQTEEIVQAIKDNGMWQGEILQKRKDNSTFTALLNVWLIKDEQGAPIGLASNSKDISERIIAENAIKEREKNFRLLLDSLPIGIYILDKNGNPYYANQFTRIFAQKGADAEIKSLDKSENWKVFKQFTNEEYPLAELPIMKALHGKKSAISDLDIEINNHRYHVSANAQPVFDNNELKYAVSTFSDISDIVEREEEINVLMNSQESYILSVDKDLNIIRFNKPFENAIKHRVPGYLSKGKSILPLIPEEEKENTIAIYKRAFEGEIVVDERTYNTRIGTLTTFETRYAPIYANGEVFAVSVNSIDITERKQKEAELKAAVKERELLLNEIHHRVKNNLAIISSLLQLEELKSDNEEVKDILISSQNRIKSTAIVHQLLYQNDSINQIHFKEYITEFVAQVKRSLSINSKIATTVFGDDFTLDIEHAIPCGLILNPDSALRK